MAKIGRSIAAIACLFVFVLLFLGTPAGAGAGAGAGGFVEQKRDCMSQSHKFKGKCFSDHNCGSVCNTEGFPRGHCRGFRQRCFCARPC